MVRTMEKIARNNRIVALKRDGVSVSDIAAEMGVSESGVRYVLRTQDRYPFEVEIPEGISLRVAWAIQNTIGLWPTPENAEEIGSRRIDLLRSSIVRRQDRDEIDAWLEWVKPKTAS